MSTHNRMQKNACNTKQTMFCLLDDLISFTDPQKRTKKVKPNQESCNANDENDVPGQKDGRYEGGAGAVRFFSSVDRGCPCGDGMDGWMVEAVNRGPSCF
uniref:Uncharacterized protein n=2 Tax=Panagrellus redivivus TaxID=6233 RepID=A0A7E4WA37_PANRE